MTMTFKYKKISRTEYIDDDYNPSVPVTLIHGSKIVDVIALLDSGADISVIPKGIADILGMNLSGERETVIGIGGMAEAASSIMSVVIAKGHEKYSIKMPVKIIFDEEDMFQPILGREEFFEAFHITFKENEKKVVLKKIA